jgi:hypothetical protein
MTKPDALKLTDLASFPGGASFEEGILGDPDPSGDPDERYGRMVERLDAALAFAEARGWIKHGRLDQGGLYFATPKGRAALRGPSR